MASYQQLDDQPDNSVENISGVFIDEDSYPNNPTEFTTLPSSRTLTPRDITITSNPPLSQRYPSKSSKHSNYRQRNYCCCFPSRRSCCSFFVFLFLLTLGGIGAAVYLCWPRIPSLIISELKPSTTSLKISGSPTNATSLNPFQVSFFGTLNLAISSENYIDWDFEYVRMRGSLMDNQGNVLDRVVGFGELKNLVIYKSAVTNVNFVS